MLLFLAQCSGHPTRAGIVAHLLILRDQILKSAWHSRHSNIGWVNAEIRNSRSSFPKINCASSNMRMLKLCLWKMWMLDNELEKDTPVHSPTAYPLREGYHLAKSVFTSEILAETIQILHHELNSLEESCLDHHPTSSHSIWRNEKIFHGPPFLWVLKITCMILPMWGLKS